MRLLPSLALALALAGAASPALADSGCVARFYKPVEVGGFGPRSFGYGPPAGTRQPSIAAAPPMAALPAPATGAPAAKKRAVAAEAAAPSLPAPRPEAPPALPAPGDDDRYPEIRANKPVRTAEQPLSTFGADVDTASYTMVARHIREGRPVPADAVRVEELINAFDYGYQAPDSAEAGFRPEIEVVPSPWSEGRKLLRIGVKAHQVPREARPRANLVFLIDVSGSMAPLDRLPLAKTSLCLLLDELKADDAVSFVTYAGSTRVALGPTKVAEREKILAALDGLEAGGSTAGASGIDLAYAQAQAGFVADGVNRVILATDGDFNVGIADPRRLKDLIERKRRSGVTLTVLGFGMGNLKDTTMQTLAEAGNGQAAYIGSLADARRTMLRGVGGTLYTVATDAKFQVEFNPARIAEWRLIGYESRALDRADFDNDRVDAGDVGAGQSVTVLYELVPAGAKGDVPELRYAEPRPAPAAAREDYAFLKIRFKPPGAAASRLIETAIDPARETADLAQASEATRFAVAVAWIGQIWRREAGVDEGGLARAIDLAKGAVGPDPTGDRIEFIDLANKARAVR